MGLVFPEKTVEIENSQPPASPFHYLHVLSEKDKLIDKKGLLVDIGKIEVSNKEKELIDIETKNHNFIANGLIVHN